jgi:hypothetical protein
VTAAFIPRLDILPPQQRELWPELRPVRDLGFVLYGGTAIALHLGHRQSVDFDFFHSSNLDREVLRRSLPFLSRATVIQESSNTFVVMTPKRVKLSFFGGLNFGRVGAPQVTNDGVLCVASFEDLMATKLKVILQRSESKDYIDIAAMVRAGVSVAAGLAAAEKMYHPTFPPSESLRALVYFEEGDMSLLNDADRELLTKTATAVRELPSVTHKPDLAPREIATE